MKSGKTYRIAVLGATGVVGEELIDVLAKRNFPVRSIRFLASSRSVGKRIGFKGTAYEVEEVSRRSFDGVDLVFASAGAATSRRWVPLAVKEGATVIDNTSAFRMDPQVPLVIPEINGQEIRKHKGVIANPNCSTIVMLIPLYQARS